MSDKNDDPDFVPVEAQLPSVASKGSVQEIEELLSNGSVVEETDADQNTALHNACSAGNKPVVEFLLEKQAKISAENNIKQRPLHLASQEGHIEIVELLLKEAEVDAANAKNEIDAGDKRGRTPLFLAIRHNHEAVAKLLLSHKADVKVTTNSHQTTLLHAAACYGRPGISSGRERLVALLLQYPEVNINAQNDQNVTPLIGAVSREYEDVAKVLVEHKANIDLTDRAERTALHHAAALGNDAIVTLLLDNLATITMLEGAHESQLQVTMEKVAGDGNTALHLAVSRGHSTIVNTLIEKGADIEKRNRRDDTAVHLACRRTDKDVEEMILQKGDFSTTNNLSQTGFYVAAQRGHIEVIKKLIDDGKLDKDLMERCPTPGDTALWQSIEQGHEDIALLLLRHGANRNIKNEDEQTCIHGAAKKGLLKVAEFLLSTTTESPESSSDRVESETTVEWFKEEDEFGRTPAQLAAEMGHDEIVVMISKHIFSAESSESEGWSVLHWAVHLDDSKVIYELVANGADISHLDNKGRTAAELAEQRCPDRSPETVAMLEWLRNPPVRETKWIPPDLELPEPHPDTKAVCKKINPYLMDFYDRDGIPLSLERFTFSIEEVIYVSGPDAIMERAAQNQKPPLNVDDFLFRWIHLPANNVTWVKDLLQTMSKFRDRDPADHYRLNAFVEEGFNEHKGPPHARFMKPSCRIDDTIPVVTPLGNDVERPDWMSKSDDDYYSDSYTASSVSSRPESVDSGSRRRYSVRGGSSHRMSFTRNRLADSEITNREKMVALQMPFLTFEKIGSLNKMKQAIRDQSIRPTPEIRDSDGKVSTKSLDSPEKLHKDLFKAYLEPLEVAGSGNQSGLHISRTLDQFYYHSLPPSETDDRDLDQVIYRYQDDKINTRQQQWKYEDYVICVVDQLWLWVIDDNTIITCFPPRWGAENSDLLDCIKNHILSVQYQRPNVNSVYQMAALITSFAISHAHRLRPDPCRESLLHMFSASIGEATSKEVRYFADFKRHVDEDTPGDFKNRQNPDHISREIGLLVEVKDIRDELNILRIILENQDTISRRLFSASTAIVEEKKKQVKRFHGTTTPESATAPATSESEDFTKDSFMKYYYERSDIDTSTREVAKMLKDSKTTYNSINHLLDLRQKDANLSEAVYTRRQAEDTASQGRIIFMFTLVTIVFLPMSFLSSLFALNISNFPHRNDVLTYPPNWAYSRIFGITAAVSVPLIIIAFLIDPIRTMYDDWKRRRPPPPGPLPAPQLARLKSREAAMEKEVQGSILEREINFLSWRKDLKELHDEEMAMRRRQRY